MQINIVYDASVAGAPSGFKTAVQAAVDFLDATIITPITVTLAFGWGEVDGSKLDSDALGESEANGLSFSYNMVRNALIAAATSAEDQVSIASLPASDPTHGGSFFVTDAEAAALGLPQDGATIDGWIGLSSAANTHFTFDPNNRAVPGEYDAIGVLEHEITEDLGRLASSGEVQHHVAQYNPLDLFRYASPGERALTPQAAYFSLDGQAVGLLFNSPSFSDPGDWAPSVVGDAFGEGASGTVLKVSSTDLTVMDVIGYTLANPPLPPSPLLAIHDFNHDGDSDILFGQANGTLAQWQMNGTQIVGGGNLGNAGGTWQVAGIGDFNADGRADVLFQDASHNVAEWLMNSTSIVGGGNIGNPGGTWAVAGIGDFNGDFQSDILFQDASHNLAIWEMSGTAIVGGGNIGNPGGTWAVKGVGDFNGDGFSDLLFQNATGAMAIWEMNGTAIIGGGNIGNPGGTWAVKGAGDFNGDGKSDILFEDATGTYAIWEMNGTAIIGGGNIGNPGGAWQFAAIGDYNGDGHADILFDDASGAVAIWEMNGTSIIGGGNLGNPGPVWHALG